MLSSRYLLIPFGAQMCCMLLDEFHFHRRRELSRWERYGHPLDTLTVLSCFVWLWLNRPAPAAAAVYAGLSVFSCLFVTKDEWVHQRHCTASEHWLHALLFILHPLSLLGAGLLWPALHAAATPAGLIRYEGFEARFVLFNTAAIFLFGLYQLLYWNLVREPIKDRKLNRN